VIRDGGRDQVVAALESALTVLVRCLGAGEVTVGARRIAVLDRGLLHAVEHEAVAAAVDRRRDEFATGRVLLRSLIGLDVPIPVAPDRRPVLPPGFLASLAHDDEFAVAVVVRASDGAPPASVGIDIEPTRPLDPGVVAVVARPDEVGIDPLLLFCAKEAAYKAWSLQGGGFLEHHDVRVRLDGSAFTATVIDHSTVLHGGWAEVAGRCVTVAVLRTAPN
jgi:4'-phosphopantetheinyl transferase EntD